MLNFLQAITAGCAIFLAFLVAAVRRDTNTVANGWLAAFLLLLSARHNHLSMVGIAFEAGFNSKTAFNTAFKKMTDRSPSEFRNAPQGGEAL